MKSKKEASKTADTTGFAVGGTASMVSDVDASMLLAAECAVRLDFDLDAFMQAAHSAYMAASPATRERMEAVQMQAYLEDLRRRGVLATA